jgi:MFS family permease
MLGPFVGRITDRFGARITVAIGVTLQVLANLAASFTVDNLGGIYATQGILFGIGTCFVSNGAISAPAQWFSKRLSLAFGLAVTAGECGAMRCDAMRCGAVYSPTNLCAGSVCLEKSRWNRGPLFHVWDLGDAQRPRSGMDSEDLRHL